MDQQPNDEQRANLLQLANYLDSLPPDYSHFDMKFWLDHRGECDIDTEELMIRSSKEYFENCGTVACAAGHGPAAGIPFLESEHWYANIWWSDYIYRAFGVMVVPQGLTTTLGNFMFGGDWKYRDNTHYGAAARIRYFLNTGEVTPYTSDYEPYLKQVA